MNLNKSGWGEFCRPNHDHTHGKLKKQFPDYEQRIQRQLKERLNLGEAFPEAFLPGGCLYIKTEKLA